MKIAFFTDMFLPQVNGPTTAIVDMAKKLADRGHQIYIIAPKFPKIHEFSYKNVAVRRCASVPAMIYKDLKLTSVFDPSILKLVKDNKIDIVHFHTPATLGLQAILVARILRLPLVGTFHGYFMDRALLRHAKLDYAFAENLAWRYSNFIYNRCDLVVCSSDKTKAELIARKLKSLIKVIPHGIDTSVFDNPKSASVKKAFNRNGKLLLFVGRVAHGKNILFLLDCLALVLRKIPTVKLVIVGSGPQLPEVKSKIKAVGIEKSVILTGEIKHEALVKSGIFGACDVFVNASEVETGPLTVLEAQANGLVCVSVKGKGMNLVKNNVNGYNVEVGDKKAFVNAIIELLTDKREYSRMKKATLKMVKKYELARIIEMWQKTYSKLLEEHKNKLRQTSRRPPA